MLWTQSEKESGICINPMSPFPTGTAVEESRKATQPSFCFLEHLPPFSSSVTMENLNFS